MFFLRLPCLKALAKELLPCFRRMIPNDVVLFLGFLVFMSENFAPTDRFKASIERSVPSLPISPTFGRMRRNVSKKCEAICRTGSMGVVAFAWVFACFCAPNMITLLWPQCFGLP